MYSSNKFCQDKKNYKAIHKNLCISVCVCERKGRGGGGEEGWTWVNVLQ